MEIHKTCNTCKRVGGDHPDLNFFFCGPAGFKCVDCSDSERKAAEDKRPENAPIERSLIARGYVGGGALEIYPVRDELHHITGESCCDVVDFDDEATYWDLVEHGKSCTTYHSLEEAFSGYLVKAKELGIIAIR